jgi:hypothetical protein
MEMFLFNLTCYKLFILNCSSYRTEGSSTRKRPYWCSEFFCPFPPTCATRDSVTRCGNFITTYRGNFSSFLEDCGMNWKFVVITTSLHASVNSSIAHPPPGNPRAFALFFCPGAGHWYLQSCPGGGELFTGRAFDSTRRFCDEHMLLYWLKCRRRIRG